MYEIIIIIYLNIYNSTIIIITTLFITVKVTNDNKHPLGTNLSLNLWGDTVGNAARALTRRGSEKLWLSFSASFSYLNVINQLSAASAGACAKQGINVQNNQLSTVRGFTTYR